MIKIYYLLPVVIFLAAGLAPQVFADTKNCEIESTGADCCKCDTGSMCLADGGKYRTCVNGCYLEKGCPTGAAQNDALCSQLAPCPGVSDACADPGKIMNPSANPKMTGADGAAYLQICGADYKITKTQCGFTLKQKKAIACFEAANGSSGRGYGVNGADGFTVGYGTIDTGKVNTLGEKIYTSILGIRDANGFTKCDDVLNQQSRQAAAESVRTGAPLGCAAAKQAGGSDTCQNLELACCLTNDHCQSYGCDENIVYDWYYGCTKIDFGKANIGAKSDAAAGAVCAAGTFGCGEGISTAGNYKSCQPSLSDIHYWSDEKKCDPNPNPTIGNCAQQDYCAHFGCAGGLSSPQTWDNVVGNEKCQAALSKTPDPGLCPKTKCIAGSGQIKQWDGKSKVSECTYVDSKFEEQFSCKKCHDDAALNKAVCDSTASSDQNQKILLSCDQGADLCRQFCYNKKKQECFNGTVVCLVNSDIADDTFDAAKNYYPPYVCNSDHTAVEMLSPSVSSSGRDSICEYDAIRVCHTDEKCAKGQCIKDAGKQTDGKELGISVKYDPQTGSGKIISDSGNAIASNLASCGKEYPSLAAISGDKNGCDNLNAALALIASASIKEKTWVEEHDTQGTLLYGPQTGTYNCTNFTDDTIKMLRANNFKETYAVTLVGYDADGKFHGHAVDAVKTSDDPVTFALIEPQSGMIIGQLGTGSDSAIVDYFNSQSDPFRIDDAAITANYKFEDSKFYYGDSDVYTYTPEAPLINSEGCISTSTYKVCPDSAR